MQSSFLLTLALRLILIQHSQQQLTKPVDQLTFIQSIFDTLVQHYGDYVWWPNDNPYEIMLGSILVQNTNWKNADKALSNLAANKTPQHIASMSLEELAQTIRPSGYYNQKAIKLKSMTTWFKGYQYDINKVRAQDKATLRKELLNVKGIGGETADVILVYAIGKPSFVIDAYTRRIFERNGLTVPKSYERFHDLMEQAIPLDTARYALYHGLMVDHGQAFCNPKPKCQHCPLRLTCVTGQSYLADTPKPIFLDQKK
ncbi:endonuclease [Photobacterium swingsii]|uniref:endonuclease III domain-containing protein n=1 Tax=Photobacterium swingsii TaxID=680026 RepID=UPI003D0A34FD